MPSLLLHDPLILLALLLVLLVLLIVLLELPLVLLALLLVLLELLLDLLEELAEGAQFVGLLLVALAFETDVLLVTVLSGESGTLSWFLVFLGKKLLRI